MLFTVSSKSLIIIACFTLVAVPERTTRLDVFSSISPTFFGCMSLNATVHPLASISAFTTPADFASAMRDMMVAESPPCRPMYLATSLKFAEEYILEKRTILCLKKELLRTPISSSVPSRFHTSLFSVIYPSKTFISPFEKAFSNFKYALQVSLIRWDTSEIVPSSSSSLKEPSLMSEEITSSLNAQTWTSVMPKQTSRGADTAGRSRRTASP